MATALAMKDAELRGLLLQAFYDRRQTRGILRPSAGWIDSKTCDDEVVRISEQLGDHGLLDWHPDYEGGAGSISAYGVDVVEGQRSPDIAVQLVNYTTNISNSSNVIVGDNNTQTVMNAIEEILRAIESSSADAASKAKSKTFLAQLASSPVIAQIIGQATKFGLDRFN
jgi:hypothetical protein